MPGRQSFYYQTRTSQTCEGGYGETCGYWLIAAAQSGLERIIEAIINNDAGVVIDKCCLIHGTPLSCAAKKGSLGVIKFLLARGANVNAWDLRYGNALGAAVDGSQLQSAESLLSCGADPNVQSGKHASPLGFTVANKNQVMAKLLLQGGSIIPQGDLLGSKLFTAIVCGSSLPLMNVLNQARLEISIYRKANDSLLSAAASVHLIERGNVDMVKLLVDSVFHIGVDTSKTDLLQAAKRAAKRMLLTERAGRKKMRQEIVSTLDAALTDRGLLRLPAIRETGFTVDV